MLQTKLMLLITGIVAVLVAFGTFASAEEGRGDLSALPGCAGQCHTNGGFRVNKNTGRKVFLKKEEDDVADGNDEEICSTRNKCGPVFCQKMRTCCVNQKCRTKPIGEPSAKDEEEDE